jgi:hypothetical protein
LEAKKKQGPEGDSQIGRESPIPEGGEPMFFRKWPLKDTNIYLIRLESVFEKKQWLNP